MQKADLVPIGFDILRNRLGERYAQFILKLGYRRKLKPTKQQDLARIGGLVGLNAAEVAGTTGVVQAILALPKWLKALLVIVAVIAGYVVVRNVLYMPGTLYASIKPDDFKK